VCERQQDQGRSCCSVEQGRSIDPAAGRVAVTEPKEAVRFEGIQQPGAQLRYRLAETAVVAGFSHAGGDLQHPRQTVAESSRVEPGDRGGLIEAGEQEFCAQLGQLRPPEHRAS
jgi:hypothetical protein